MVKVSIGLTLATGLPNPQTIDFGQIYQVGKQASL